MHYVYATLAVLTFVTAVISLIIGGTLTNTLLLIANGTLFALAAEVSDLAAVYRRQHPPAADPGD